MILRSLSLIFPLFHQAFSFWDMGTTTESGNPNKDDRPRQSFFRWQRPESESNMRWYGNWDHADLRWRKRTAIICGYSLYFTNLSVGAILNRRSTLTSANFIEPWKPMEGDMRIWALGRAGGFESPYRYRVWRCRRLLPRSNNPEHWHGPRGQHVPRHDLAIVQSMDCMYIYPYLHDKWFYATRGYIYDKHDPLQEEMAFAGQCYEDGLHIRENYKIYYARVYRKDVVDCSKFLPKWWGKFICIRNPANRFIRIACVQNGGPLITKRLWIAAIGCFEIRYNEERILVFTDLRYYIDLVHVFANMSAGEYYEYAYQQYGNIVGWMYDGGHNNPYITQLYVMHDLYPLGK